MLSFCVCGLTQGCLTMEITTAPSVDICFSPCEQETVFHLYEEHTAAVYQCLRINVSILFFFIWMVIDNIAQQQQRLHEVFINIGFSVSIKIHSEGTPVADFLNIRLRTCTNSWENCGKYLLSYYLFFFFKASKYDIQEFSISTN